jgi:hypothetical protein
MADPRIISIDLDERSLGWRSADVEQERRMHQRLDMRAVLAVHMDAQAAFFGLQLDAVRPGIAVICGARASRLSLPDGRSADHLYRP